MTVESLTPVTGAELLERVKKSEKFTGTYHDDELTEKIAEIKLYLESAGVSADVLGSTLAVGCIARGVINLIEDGALSDYFYQRAEQLRCVEVADNG